MGSCPFCKESVDEAILEYGGRCPSCLIEIPGEDAPTDPGEVAKAAQEAAHADIDPRFLFVSPGYNLRPMELSGAMGRVQIKRLAGFVEKRRHNHRRWCEMIRESGLPVDVFDEVEGTVHAGFGFPLLLAEEAPLDRTALCAALESRHITTRPISGANLTRQPAFSKVPGVRVEGPLPIADAIHDRGLFVGQSHAFDDRHGELLVDALRAALT